MVALWYHCYILYQQEGRRQGVSFPPSYCSFAVSGRECVRFEYDDRFATQNLIAYILKYFLKITMKMTNKCPLSAEMPLDKNKTRRLFVLLHCLTTKHLLKSCTHIHTFNTTNVAHSVNHTYVPTLKICFQTNN